MNVSDARRDMLIEELEELERLAACLRGELRGTLKPRAIHGDTTAKHWRKTQAGKIVESAGRIMGWTRMEVEDDF